MKIRWDEDICPVVCGYLLVALLVVTPFMVMKSVHDYRGKHENNITSVR